MLTVRGNIITTNEYWDCSCNDDYIHPMSVTQCNRCGFTCEDSPDSRLDEVLKFGYEINEKQEEYV